MRGLYQSLVEFAACAEVIQKPHHGKVKFKWQLELNTDGSLASSDLVPLTTTQTRGRKEHVDPWVQHLAPTSTRTSGVFPLLGGDDIAYVLGWHESPDEEADDLDGATREAQSKRQADSIKRHDAWRDLSRDWAEFARGSGDPVPQAILSFLKLYVTEVRKPDQWTAKDRVLVRVEGKPAFESSTAALFWQQRMDSRKGSGAAGICLICATTGQLVDSFPMSVSGPLIPQGQTSGVAPISINKDVFGYGLRDGLDQVPVCMSCSLAVVSALNYLLSADEHRSRSVDSVTTWWIDAPAQTNYLEILDRAQAEDVAALFRSVVTARTAPALVDLTEFHSLTVQANGPRMIVRDWTHMPVGQLQVAIADWFRDTEIEPLRPEGRRFHPLWELAQCTGRFVTATSRYLSPTDKGSQHPHGIIDTLREVALRKEPLPRHVVAHILQRVRADGRVDDPRAALLRLHLVRNRYQKGSPMPGLDINNTKPSYLLGRLLSVYEDTQRNAATVDGGQAPNASFADKYLAGAITSPRLVLLAGSKQSAAWLSKLRRGGRDFYAKRQIDEILSQLDADNPGPVRATLDEQAQFILGYHHQRGYSNAQRQVAIESKKLAETLVPSTNKSQGEQL